MKSLSKIILTFFLFCFSLSTFALENLVYVLRSNSPDMITNTKNMLADLENYHKKINIIVSQAYQVDERGIVWGFIDPKVLADVKKYSMKLMPMITNAGFDKHKTHQFLSSPAAQKRAINYILKACKQNNYYGVQFDFEMISLDDKDVLTEFYQTAAKALHQAGLVVSFAVAPLLTDDVPAKSDFLKKRYVTWEGAYDLKLLGESADFLTIMAYNQHEQGTAPGPTASAQWVDAVIQFALQYVPANKISLGIATYSGYWYTGASSGRIYLHMADMSYDKVNYLLERYHATLQWDDKDKVNYAMYEHNWLNEYIFVEDAKSFAAKLALAKKYHLRGISIFYIGIEDPNLWREL